MRDDSHMDPVAVACEEIFGGAVDPRELSDFISKQNDASEMHVPGNLKVAAKKVKDKPKDITEKKVPKDISQIPAWQKNVALATNAAGVVAGPAAIALAARAAWHKEGGIPREGMKLAGAQKKFPKVARAANKSVKFLRNNKKAAIAVGATGVGLQVANMAGDAIATRAFAGQRVKEKKFAEQRKKKVEKALGDIVAARRMGLITTDKALELVSKIDMNPDAKAIHQQAAAMVPLPSDPAPKALPGKMKLKKTGVTTKPKAPNKTPEPFGKSEDPVLTWTGEIEKMDTEKRQVFGYCTVTHVNGEEVIDLQGDYVPLEEIEKAAYTYVVNSRKGGDMHARDGEVPLHTSDMIESFIVTPEKLEKMGLERDAIPHGWWVGFQVNDDKQWEMVKSGERTAFSIHGSGRRVEKML